ncbi:MAG: lysophospholipid acyltransferase family protein [Oligoflexus sp.]
MRDKRLAKHPLMDGVGTIPNPKTKTKLYPVEILLWSLCRITSWIPPRILEKLAFGFAVFCFDILRLRRKVILNNLKIAFGEEKTESERRRIGRLSVYHFLLTILEFLRSPYHDIAAHVQMHDRENIDKILEKGNGAYIICFHIGNWEAHSPAVTRQVKPVHIVVKKVGSYAMNRFVETVRQHNRFLWIKRERKGDAFQAMKKILANNEIVGFVFDQARPGEPRLPFFGKTAKTNTSFAAIRRQMPAPVVSSFARRVRLGEHIVEYSPEIPFVDTEDTAQDILNHSAQINRIVESVVRRYPEHYFWFHNRWK